jgi:hypothetical protein
MNKGGAINYQGDCAEANLQAEFYHHCRLIGLNCLLEFTTPTGRHDLAIFNSDFTRLLALVECKKKVIARITSQIARYKAVGVPVYQLNCIHRAERLAKTIQANCHDQSGIECERLSAIPKQRRRWKYTKETHLDYDMGFR